MADLRSLNWKLVDAMQVLKSVATELASRVPGPNSHVGCDDPVDDPEANVEWYAGQGVQKESPSKLEDQVAERVREWVRRVGPRFQGAATTCSARLTIGLGDPGWDDDGRPSLTAYFEETANTDDVDGVV